MIRLVMLVGIWLAFTPASADPFRFQFEELAPGVWTGVREVNTRFPVMGSVTFVVTDEGVVVYDGGGVALMAERTIDKIRSITDKPVTHVIISHWHGDHHFGIYRYLEEFTNVQVIAHEFTDRIFQSEKIRYIDRQPALVTTLVPRVEKMLATGVHERSGEPLSDGHKKEFQQIIADQKVIQQELARLRITLPTLIVKRELVIRLGSTRIEVLYLGDGNTAGDLVMWLPQSKIVATGDIVVHPIPYGFNVPPVKWATTMRAILQLGYKTLVPGHGDIQHDTGYIDLLIEEAEAIAGQRDKWLATGLSEAEALDKLDFSRFESRHTGGDPYLAYYYDAYFKKPFSEAVFKALKGEPMVVP